MKAMKNKKTAGAALITIFAILLGLVFALQTHGRSPDPILPLGSEALSSLTTEHRVPGLRYRSSIKLTSEAELKLHSDIASDHKVSTTLEATLLETVVKFEEGQSQSYLHIKNPELTLDMNHPQASEMKSLILSGLEKGALIIRDRNGLVATLILAPDTNDLAREYLYMIAKATQFNLPIGHLQGEWSSAETDLQGLYEANYELDQKSTGTKVLSVRKQKIRYRTLNAQVRSSVGDEARIEGDTSGELTLIYDRRKQALTQIFGTEELRLVDRLGRDSGFNRLKTEWSLDSIDKAEADDLKEWQRLAQEHLDSGQTYAEAAKDYRHRQDRAMYEQRLGDDTLDTLHSSYESLKSQDLAEAEADKVHTELYLKLRAFVYLHPEELSGLVERLHAMPIEEAFVQSLISAMVSISSPAAQEALVQLAYKKQGSLEAMQTLVPKLSFIQEPQESVIEALRSFQLQPELKGMAELAFGTMASQLAKAEDEKSRQLLREVDEELIAKTRAAQGTPDFVHHLDVLGNYASTSALDILLSQLSDDSSRIRATAAFALRDIDHESAIRSLLEMAVNDEAVEARLAALQALGSSRPTPAIVSRLSERVHQEKDSEARMAYAQVLARARFVAPDTVRLTLEKMAQSDANEPVRSLASGLLAGLN